MPLIAAEADWMLDQEGTRLLYLSIHTADPSTTGANEAAGGSYARQPITWNASTGGAKSAVQCSFTPNGASYGWYGYWSAATGGVFRGSAAFTGGARTTVTGDTLKVTANLTETLS